MNVSLDLSKLSAAAAAANAAISGEAVTPPVSASKKIIRGTGVTVSSVDVDKLAEKLLAETDSARERSLLSSFSSLSELFEHLMGEVTAEQKKQLEELDSVTGRYRDAVAAEKRKAKAVVEAKNGVTTADTNVKTATEARDAAKAAREGLTRKEGETEEAFNKRVGKADEDVEDAETALTEALGAQSQANTALTTATNEHTAAVKKVKSTKEGMSKALAAIDSKSYQALTEAVRLSASDLAHLNPLAQDEEEETAGDATLAEMSPFDAIRHYLMQEAEELLDVQEEQFAQHV